MSFLVVANAAAGSSDGVEAAAALLDAYDACEVQWTEDPEDIDRVLSADRTPVIAGGDGSIHLVVNRLAALDRLDRPVGLLPMGTGNDLARGLGIPLDPEEAARHLIRAAPTRLPLLSAPDGEVGVNNAHTGLGVAAARRGAEWKERLGPLSYTAGSITEGLSYDGLSVEVTVDGDMLYSGECLALMVLVGPSAGGGFRPLSDVDPADPILDVLVVGTGERPDRTGLVANALAGRLEDDDEVLRQRGRRVQATVGGEEWELDGEFRSWADPVGLSLDARTWTVLT